MAKKKHALFSRDTLSDRIVLTVNYVLLSIFLFIILYPLLFVIFSSVSGGADTMSLTLIPKKFSFAGYNAVIEYKDIWIGYKNSLFYTFAGTAIALAMTTLMAYPLSRSDFKAKGFLMTLCMITMYFSGGLIPTFIIIKKLGLLNTRWALLLPGSMSVYNMIVMRTYFKSSIPGELLESSQLDGCGNIRYLISIVLPLSGPILAVIGLYYAVGIWNSYFDAMVYVATKRNLFPLALFLREILVDDQTQIDNMDIAEKLAIEERRHVMKYAVIVVSSLPVMILYPFVQRFFVKGVMVGAVKG